MDEPRAIQPVKPAPIIKGCPLLINLRVTLENNAVKKEVKVSVAVNYRTNLTESLRMLTRLFSVFVGSLPCGAGYGN